MVEIRKHKQEIEPDEKIKVIVSFLIIVGLIGLSIMMGLEKEKSDEIMIENLEQSKQLYALKIRKLKSEKLFPAFERLFEEGRTAMNRKAYFDAVFKYKQAIVFNENSLKAHQELKIALEKSCLENRENHCKEIAKIKRRIEFLKDNSSFDILE